MLLITSAGHFDLRVLECKVEEEDLCQEETLEAILVALGSEIMDFQEVAGQVVREWDSCLIMDSEISTGRQWAKWVLQVSINRHGIHSIHFSRKILHIKLMEGGGLTVSK